MKWGVLAKRQLKRAVHYGRGKGKFLAGNPSFSTQKRPESEVVLPMTSVNWSMTSGLVANP